VNHRRFFFWLTGLILAAAIGAIALWGLPLSIDFTGGSLVEVAYPAGRPALAAIKAQVDAAAIGPASVIPSGANDVKIRAKTLSPAEHAALLSALDARATSTAATSTSAGQVSELSFTSVGPALGSQFAHKALWAILAVVLAIVLYIAFAFRQVSRPVPSWGYGLTVVLMLAIDIIVPTGFYAALCHYTGAEVDSLFVVALLALLGYVVNDIIVVFDRVREHLKNNEKMNRKEPFDETVGKSIDETMARSINTALTVVLALGALIWLGAPATRDFALVMLVGVVAGTFSSICRSAPFLIPLARYFEKKR
ncbi:MAG: protein translocase subunit SecF, partial [Patescibacteria group bacterium]|nr:protein translocase subunit SecF [Patescibacteria group bacterium]